MKIHGKGWERLERHLKTLNFKCYWGDKIFSYRHYSDDVVEEFVKKSIENGIDIIRIFDALNDPRNIRKSLEATKKYGGHAQIAISYTTSPVHNNEYYINLSKELEKMGADSICIKDMSGILLPYEAEKLVKGLKENIKIPIQIHLILLVE